MPKEWQGAQRGLAEWRRRAEREEARAPGHNGDFKTILRTVGSLGKV